LTFLNSESEYLVLACANFLHTLENGKFHTFLSFEKDFGTLGFS